MTRPGPGRWPTGSGTDCASPFVLDGLSLTVDASIGVALCPEHGRDRSLLLARADTAMYAAKRGRRGCAVWAPDAGTSSRSRLETLEQLRVALNTDQLTDHYQPKLDLHTGRVTGVEALVRCHGREGGRDRPQHAAAEPGLGMTMVVEGVEDAAALAALRAWNCDLAQGFHITRPMPAAGLLPWLRSRKFPAEPTTTGP